MKSLQKGKLKRWNDDKGFGFIASEDGKDIFIHISALKKMMNDRPKVGDIITYQIHTDNDGKKRAVNAKVEGVAEAKQKSVRKPVKPVRTNIKKQNNVRLFFKVILISLLGSIAYILFFANNKPLEETATSTSEVTSTPSYAEKQENRIDYSCEGKVHCSEMDSCDEARFYQNNCPGTKMDGDGDGIPCERQCN